MNILAEESLIEPVEPPVGSYFVTGAAGSIGGAVYDALPIVEGCDHNEEAVAKRPSVMLGDYLHFGKEANKCDYVIHAAAYKHVPLGERSENRGSFYFNNYSKLVVLAQEVGSRMLLLSTDKAAGESYMGETKRKAEGFVVASGGWALRMVNVAYSKGSCLDNWEKEDVVRLVKTDCYRYFMTRQDAVNLIFATIKEKPGLYTVHGFPEVSVRELGLAYAKRAGKDIEWMELRAGEKERESLIGHGESLQNCKHPNLKRIV